MPDPLPDIDERLVRRCLAGEPAAWTEFVGRFRPVFEAAIRPTLARSGLRGDSAAVDDVAQEILLSLLKDGAATFRRYDGRASLRNFLMAIAVRRTYDHLRALPRELSPRPFGEEERLWQEVVSADGASPEDAGETEARRIRVRNALKRLSPREQAALRLYYWGGLPPEGTARILGLKPSWARTLMTRARGKLRRILSSALLFL